MDSGVHRRTETPTLGLHRAAASRLHGPVALRLHCFTVSFLGDVRGESGPR